MSSENQKLRLLLKDCASGFYQQMYFLGKDVSHCCGNQLIEYGFEKSPSTGLTGTSCYTFINGSQNTNSSQASGLLTTSILKAHRKSSIHSCLYSVGGCNMKSGSNKNLALNTESNVTRTGKD